MRHGEEIVLGQNLVLGYRGRGSQSHVVEGLDLSVRAGQMVCLIGPNGAGKSTLLKTLCGTLEPLSGTLRVAGGVPSRMRPGEIAAAMALVFNERPANLGIRVEELVALGRLPHTGAFGHLGDRDRRAIDAAMESTGSSPLRGRRFGELSDGERVRVQVARALAQDTPLLLLDEPTAHLDWPYRIALCCLLRRLAREHGKAVFLSTHELDLALQVADQWVLVSPGCPPVCAAPEEVALSGAFDRAFGSAGFHLEAASGQIRLDRPTSRSIRLSGEGDAREWTARALERMGWSVAADAPDEVRVEKTDSGFLWTHGTRNFGHLELLLRELSHGTGTVKAAGDAA